MKKLRQAFRKTFIAIISAIMLVGNLNTIPVQAATKVNITKTETGYWHTGKATAPNGDYSWFNQQPITKFKISDGRIGFCIEPWYLVNNGNGYTPSQKNFEELSHIIYHGFWNTNQSNWNYAVTQLMVWEYYGYKPTTNVSGYANRKKEIQKLVNAHNKKPSFNGKTYTVDVGETLELTDTNKVISQFSNWKAEGCTVKVSGNKLQITPTSDSGKKVTIRADKYKEKYIGTSLLYKKSGNQSVYSGFLQDPTRLTITLNVNQFGSLKIAKVDEDGTYVPSTSFSVSKNSDMSDSLGTYTTGSNGTVTVSDLAPGTYYVQETAVPDHLVLDSTIHKVTVSANETTTFTANNDWKKGKVQLKKIDKESDKQVAGAVYGIFDKSGNEVERLTTLANGYAQSGWLRFGEYYVQEIIAPNGYVLDDTKYPVNITENEQTIYVTGVDQRVKGTINIEKQDSITGSTAQGEATLQGAVYGLYARENIIDPADGDSIIHEADEKIRELTIGEDQTATASDLYLGKYYVKELEAPEGYVLDETEYDIELKYKDQETANVVVNQTVTDRVKARAFSILKLSQDVDGNTDFLAGAEFTIKSQKDIDKYGSWEKAPIAKNAKGAEAAVLVTDEKGYAVSDELPYGTYVVRETKVPAEHYAVDDFTVVIDEDNREPIGWEKLVDKEFGAMPKLVKQDAETGKTVALAGAKFKIYDLQNEEYIGYFDWGKLQYVTEFETGEDGTVIAQKVLKPGKYQAEEIQAPNGYILNEEPVEFEVSIDGMYEVVNDTPIIAVTMKDTAVMGQITIEKIGDVLVGFENGKFVYEERGIAGMEADVIAAENILDPANDGTVLYKAGTVVDTITTGADGKATSKKIPLGKYKVKETKAPAGFVLNGKEYEVDLKYADQETAIVSESVTVQNEKQNVSLKVLKQEAGTPLSGGQFGLYADEEIKGYDGSVLIKKDVLIATTAAENGMIEFDVDLPLFSYYVKELEAPTGYAKTDEVIRFDAFYQGQDIPVVELEEVLENEATEIEVSKIDASTGKELPNAQLTIYEEGNRGNTFLTWTSEEEPRVIRNLDVDTKWVLEETAAPDGFAITNKVVFELDEYGKLYIYTGNGEKHAAEENKIVMKDELTHIQVLKVDEEGNPLAGNVLAIEDTEGNIIEQWISEETPHDVYGLIGGAEYILKEIKPADGYGTAKEITFTVPTTANDIITITMSNRPTEMEVWKVDDDNQPLAGALLQIIDAETNEIISEFTSETEAILIPYLVEGKEYILHEVKAPLGYEVAEDIRFTAGAYVKIEMQDHLIHSYVEVKKVDYYDRDKALPFAEFTMYEDKDCTKAIDVQKAGKDGVVRFEDIPFGTTVYIKETAAPVGYKLSDEIVTVTIDEAWVNGDKDTRLIIYPDEPLPESGGNTGVDSGIGAMMAYGAMLIGSFITVLLLQRRKNRGKDHA